MRACSAATAVCREELEGKEKDEKEKDKIRERQRERERKRDDVVAAH